MKQVFSLVALATILFTTAVNGFPVLPNKRQSGNQVGQNKQTNENGRNIQNQGQFINGYGNQVGQNKQQNTSGINPAAQNQDGYGGTGNQVSQNEQTNTNGDNVSNQSQVMDDANYPASPDQHEPRLSDLDSPAPPPYAHNSPYGGYPQVTTLSGS